MLPNIYDIEFLCGAHYRGELKGQYRHGVGAISYLGYNKGQYLIGYWKNDNMIYDGVEHPTRALEAISVALYEGLKRKS